MTESAAEPTLRIGDPPAPGNLVLVEGFLNTWSGELGFEDFSSVADTEKWLKQYGLWKGNKRLTSANLEKIVEFRQNLREWILDSESTRLMEGSLSDVTFHARVEAGNLSFQPNGDPYQFLVGTIANAISESQSAGTWERFNPRTRDGRERVRLNSTLLNKRSGGQCSVISARKHTLKV